jgi:hypothetical protein
MLLTVATTLGLVIWVVLWSLGAKGFDAFMITVVVILAAATVKMALPYLPGNRAE